METFVFSKTMNNPSQRFPSHVVAVSLLCVALGAAPVRGQTQTPGEDRASVPLSDPSQPALVKASLINGGITVKAYDGKDTVAANQATPNIAAARKLRREL